MKKLKTWDIKYYKGLGTSDNEEAKEYFSDLPKHTIIFKHVNEEDDKSIDLAFSRTQADARKDWLNTYDENIFVDHSMSHVTYKDFVNKELIGFSRFSWVRAIPSICDGFKPGQRKILFACFKRNLIKEIKVAQLSGYVAEKSAYHHGEQSLASTIVGMAQNFVGSNNISYLEPKGQFGTRAMGGKDAASARYIYTHLTPIAKWIFHKHDRFLLNYLNEEGISIEPEYYIPVIPMVLVNGAEGIGTGWSTFIPCFNPIEIIEALKQRMDGKPFERLTPWYKHYKGHIEYDRSNYLVRGDFSLDEHEKKLRITELPIRKWTREYKKFLETLLEKDVITDLREYHGSNQVDFELFYDKSEGYFDDDDTIIKQFKLSTTLSDNNYVLFDKDNKLKRYADETEILDEFYDVRLDLYKKRKDYLLRKLRRDLEILDNKVRFITEVVNEDIVVHKRKKKELLKTLRERGYSKYSDIMAIVPEENAQESERKLSDNEEEKIDGDEPEEIVDLASDYNYLLNQAIWTLTEERIDALKKEKDRKEGEIVNLEKVSELDLWRQDLDVILDELDKVEQKELTLMHKDKDKLAKMKNKARPKAKKSNKGDKENAKPATKNPPKKERTKKRPGDITNNKEITKMLKKGNETTTTSEVSSDIQPKKLEDLPLVERMRIKKQMRDQEKKGIYDPPMGFEEKKGSYEPSMDSELYGKSEKIKAKAAGKGQKRNNRDYDEDSEEDIPVKSSRVTRNKGQRTPLVNLQDEDISEDSDSSFGL